MKVPQKTQSRTKYSGESKPMTKKKNEYQEPIKNLVPQHINDFEFLKF